MKKHIISPLLIAVFTILFISGCGHDQKRGFVFFEFPQGVVQQYIDAAAEGDFNKLRKLTTGEALRDVQKFELDLAGLSEQEKSTRIVKLKNRFQNISVTSQSGGSLYKALDSNKVEQTVFINNTSWAVYTVIRKDSTSPWYISQAERTTPNFPMMNKNTFDNTYRLSVLGL